MSRVDHPATAIRPPSEPPAASQRDARGVPHQVWVKILDTGHFCPILQGVAQSEVGQLLAAVTEPQRRGLGEPMCAPGPQVAVDRSGGVRSERGGPWSTISELTSKPAGQNRIRERSSVQVVAQNLRTAGVPQL
jgi:hypothetical protein